MGVLGAMSRDRDQVEADWLLEHGRTREEVARMQAAAASPRVWLVIGTCGEYSDRKEWVVAAYFSRELAEAHADAAMQEERRIAQAWTEAGFDEYHLNSGAFLDMDTPEQAALRANRFDLKVQRDYTGTDYHAAESCDLRVALP